MAMDWATSNEFDRIMRDGDWHYSKADSYEHLGYYGDARNHYYYAMHSYQDAERLASSHDDYKKYDALSKYNYCRSKFSEMSSKGYDEPRNRY